MELMEYCGHWLKQECFVLTETSEINWDSTSKPKLQFPVELSENLDVEDRDCDRSLPC